MAQQQILGSFKFVQAKRVMSNLDPVTFRRNKLIRKLDEQIAMAKANASGASYAVKRKTNVVDKESGAKTSVEVSRKLRSWYFTNETGKLCVQLRYGSKVIEFAKNRNAIEVANESELIAVLEKLREAVNSGELDQQITIAADLVKARFKK